MKSFYNLIENQQEKINKALTPKTAKEVMEEAFQRTYEKRIQQYRLNMVKRGLAV
jgi:hypothetical protein